MYKFPDNFKELNDEQRKAVMDDLREYNRYERTLNKLSNFLLADLAVRENNYHTGTARGGNPTQLFYLLTHKVRWTHTKAKTASLCVMGDDLVMTVPEEIILDVEKDRDADLAQLRDALDVYCAALSSIQEVTTNQLMDPIWLESQNVQNPEVKIYLVYLKKIAAFNKDLSFKDKIFGEYCQIFKKEEALLQKRFFEEIGLTEEEGKQSGELLDGAFSDHPVFGAQLDKISERESQVLKALFSEEDILLLKTINVMPSFLVILTMRSVSIEKLVKYNFDEFVGNEKFDKIKVKNYSVEISDEETDDADDEALLAELECLPE